MLTLTLMEMDFMERLVQWLSSLTLLLLLLPSCSKMQDEAILVEKFYDNGQRKEQRYYCEGKMVGTHKGWWPNGQQKYEYNYSQDMFDGKVREWYENGQLYKRFHYKDGHEEGFQQMWKADGRIEANYEVRDGRKYGLTGVKNCTSVWNENDSIPFKEKK